ncbi:MAG TPA: L,D-transpeptidase family protein, partial [Vicinamibacteria bacterium]
MPSSTPRLAVPALLIAAALASPALDATNAAAPVPLAGAPELAVDPARLAASLGATAEDRQWLAVQSFYEARQLRPAWVHGHRVGRDADALLRALSGAEADGLDPERYGATHLRALKASIRDGQRDRGRLAELDLRLTYAFLLYATDLMEGRFNPRGASGYWALRPAEADVATLLAASLEEGRFSQALAGLLPGHPQYLALRSLRARYQGIAAAGGWDALPPALRVKPGQRHPGVPALRRRLERSGDLAQDDVDVATGDAEVLDAVTVAALERFQARHGLDADGAVGKGTLAALNVPVEDRLRGIEVNMERWRWLPRDLGARHILVNIPAFELFAFEDGREELRMKVVTGRAGESPTPVFSEEMETVVFSPYWNVPPGILQDEVIPAMARNPGYLRRQNMEVIRGAEGIAVRQRPGRGNALGLVKFLFPNRFNVYLHDTPSRSLFGRTVRTFSHGCIRIEKPLDLAEHLLRGDPAWTREKIESRLGDGRERWIAVPRPLPVHVVYWTAWVDAAGVLQFRKDVYGRDRPVL